MECLLSNESTVLIEMGYCWDAIGQQVPWETTPYYFMNALELLLNNRWLEFYRWVQEQFDRRLEEQATDDIFAEYDD